MPALRDLLPRRLALVPAAHLPLLAFAAIVAVSLLSFYVHLLHESMTLGEQMRERQRSSTSVGPMKSSLPRSPVLGTAGRGARSGDNKR